MSVIIHHPDMGVYLGNCMGLGFWSKLDPAGQDTAATFPDEDAARDHLFTWDDPVDGCEFLEVHVDESSGEHYASIEACVAAGCEAWDPTILSYAS